MDVNYSRWMSKDPDAEPEVVEDEPRRFTLPSPSRSAVASTAMVSLIVLGGGALVRSIATTDVSSEQPQTVQTQTADEDSGPGAASIDDSTVDEVTSDDSTADDATSDESTLDESTLDESDDSSSDEGATRDDLASPGPRIIVRHELQQPDGLPPGEPWRDHPPRGHRVDDGSLRRAPGPPMPRP